MSIVQLLPGREQAKLAPSGGHRSTAAPAELAAGPAAPPAGSGRPTRSRSGRSRSSPPGSIPTASSSPTSAPKRSPCCSSGCVCPDGVLVRAAWGSTGCGSTSTASGPAVHALYELLFNQRLSGARFRGRPPAANPRSIDLPVGVDRAGRLRARRGVFPYPDRSFPGYRLLQEYFAFPEKFLFFDVTGLEGPGQPGLGRHGRPAGLPQPDPRCELVVRADNFRLGCTPAVNLFTLVAEPISLNQTQFEYRVVPDVNRPSATEVYSIDAVTSTSAYLDDPVELRPSTRCATSDADAKSAYWYATQAAERSQGRPRDRGLPVVRRLRLPAPEAGRRDAHGPRHLHQPRPARSPSVRRGAGRLRAGVARRR